MFSDLEGRTYKGDVKLTITGSWEDPDFWKTDVPGDEVKGGIFLLLLAALLGEQRALERCARQSAAWREADNEGRRALRQKDPLEQLLGTEDDDVPGGGPCVPGPRTGGQA
jgi:hypothetical protein